MPSPGLSTITITAAANGSLQPPTAIKPDDDSVGDVTNGDFIITGNPGTKGLIVGDGADENTVWNFDFNSDPNFSFFSNSLSLSSAILTLVLTPKQGAVSTDIVRITGLPGIQDIIPTLDLDVTSTITIDLLNYYPPAQILNILFSDQPGIVPMYYDDDAIVSRAKLELIQLLPSYQYAVKVVCGKENGRILAKGSYHTAINIHNPLYESVSFRIKYAVALPGQPGEVTKFFDAKLGPDEALEIDCPEIMKAVHNKRFVKGFAIIESETELDVVAVYTASSSREKHEGVPSFHSERVAPRIREVN